MRTTLVATAMIAAAAPALAADSYVFDAAHTRPSFLVNHLGFSTQHGRFGKAGGRIVLDPAAKKGSVEVTIDTASIDMGTDKWNQHMKSEEFFNVEKYPSMTFRSDKLIFAGDKIVGADGQFTLLGVTRPLTVTVANFRCAMHPMLKRDACGGDVSATIRRSDFGMIKFLPAVGDDVKINVPVEALREQGL
jgi:polyisoprenoid-binding protein YceI